MTRRQQERKILSKIHDHILKGHEVRFDDEIVKDVEFTDNEISLILGDTPPSVRVVFGKEWGEPLTIKSAKERFTISVRIPLDI